MHVCIIYCTTKYKYYYFGVKATLMLLIKCYDNKRVKSSFCLLKVQANQHQRKKSSLNFVNLKFLGRRTVNRVCQQCFDVLKHSCCTYHWRVFDERGGVSCKHGALICSNIFTCGLKIKTNDHVVTYWKTKGSRSKGRWIYQRNKNRSQCFKHYGLGTVSHVFFG